MNAGQPRAENFIRCVNDYAGKGIPFVFLVDFEIQKPLVLRLEEAAAHGFYYNFRGLTNRPDPEPLSHQAVRMEMLPVSPELYGKAFGYVREELQKGNSYLLNLTFPTRLITDLDLPGIFRISRAPYRLWLEDRFVLFSPECFIRIREGRIHTFPMKGTKDAMVDQAEEQILADRKEIREHNTVVDLLRNDLSMVAGNVRVTRFRYTERIKTHRNELIQVSSEITGDLPSGWQNMLGDMLLKMLPAGSVSGAPKRKTLEIIRAAEQSDRGYYTGICGIFDGKDLDSAVNIRYIEKTAEGLQFRSGGGITHESAGEDEYRELISKVYVPVA